MFYHQSRTSTPTRSDKEDKKSSELTHGTQESDLVVISKTNEVTFSKFDQDQQSAFKQQGPESMK